MVHDAYTASLVEFKKTVPDNKATTAVSYQAARAISMYPLLQNIGQDLKQ